MDKKKAMYIIKQKNNMKLYINKKKSKKNICIFFWCDI